MPQPLPETPPQPGRIRPAPPALAKSRAASAGSESGGTSTAGMPPGGGKETVRRWTLTTGPPRFPGGPKLRIWPIVPAGISPAASPGTDPGTNSGRTLAPAPRPSSTPLPDGWPGTKRASDETSGGAAVPARSIGTGRAGPASVASLTNLGLDRVRRRERIANNGVGIRQPVRGVRPGRAGAGPGCGSSIVTPAAPVASLSRNATTRSPHRRDRV